MHYSRWTPSNSPTWTSIWHWDTYLHTFSWVICHNLCHIVPLLNVMTGGRTCSASIARGFSVKPIPEANARGCASGTGLRWNVVSQGPRQCGCCVGEAQQWGHLCGRLISMIERHNPPCYLTCWMSVIKTRLSQGLQRHWYTGEIKCVYVGVCVCVCTRIICASRLQDCVADRAEEFTFFSRVIWREMPVSQNTMAHFIMTFCKVQTLFYCSSWIPSLQS